MLTTIHRVKAQMLTLQRSFTQHFIRINDTLIGGESISTFQLGERRRKKTVITHVQNERGELLQSAEEIENHMFEYFRGLYAAVEPGEAGEERFECDRIIPENDEANEACVAEISTSEILKAIRSSAAKKSPGEDGLPKEFYHRAFDVIHRELNFVMNEAMTTEFPPEFTNGTIVLVKKRGNDETARAYRPISLLNVDFKIFSRILKTRLEHVLRTHQILSDAQKCSNPGRSIFQATLSLKDRIAELISRKRKGKLISWDLSNAFDRVSHSFLHRTMLSLGIQPNFVALLARIAERSSSRLMLNGRLSQPMKIERSVRQGDPMSMLLFVLYLHPFLTRLENICGGDLCVAYADDVTIIATSLSTIERASELFRQFEIVAGAKLNIQKTVAIDVGFIDGDPLVVPWLQTSEKMKVLGITFANSIRLMIKLNWDALAAKFAQHVWLHSLRSLTLIQKVTLLNTFISSKMWYLASTLPPYCVHTAKITATMGSFIWRGFPARVPMTQLARSREQGGLKLQLPMFKCKALLLNRHVQDIDSLPFYRSFLAQDNPPPADFPCLRLICQQYPLLPPLIQEHPSSDLIHRLFVEQTELPRVERNQPGLNWKQIWRNIANKRLTSSQRSGIYLLVNEKTQHRRLLNIMQRAENENCLHCGAAVETIKHKFSECPRVAAAWAYIQREMMAFFNGWQRPTFEDLLRPTLYGVGRQGKSEILKKLINYINFVNNENNRIDVAALQFYLECEG